MSCRCWSLLLAVSLLPWTVTPADEPPELNPFGKNPSAPPDSVPGVVELSDGTVHIGRVDAPGAAVAPDAPPRSPAAPPTAPAEPSTVADPQDTTE